MFHRLISNQPTARRRSILPAALLLLLLLVLICPLRPGIVQGCSMRPTLEPGRPFLYRKVDSSTPIARGEVVLVRLHGQIMVKRVFAVAGDMFRMIGARGAGTGDSRVLASDVPFGVWRRRFPQMRYRRVVVPEGRLFLLGDGERSLDSRQLGCVPAGCVIGKVLAPDAGRSSVGCNAVRWNELPAPRTGGGAITRISALRGRRGAPGAG